MTTRRTGQIVSSFFREPDATDPDRTLHTLSARKKRTTVCRFSASHRLLCNSCPAFVQTSSKFAPGMVVGPSSVIGGTQYIIELTYWHTGGRWWLYFNGTAASDAIGYYPDTIYKGGCLAGNASEIDFGGEVVGTTSFPPMGSGRFAKEGWQKAAYQRTIGYYNPLGGAMVQANLTASQGWPSCPSCYTALVVKYGEPWDETLWYGGSGGSC
ncbi:MAG: neprosin family prolyl endopeptidase [Halobacteriota archaeon]